MPLNESRFREIVSDHLLPFFSGAGMSDAGVISTSREKTVALTGICTLRLKPSKQDLFAVAITRSQPFAAASSPSVTEHRVAQSFIDVLDEMSATFGTPVEQDLLSHIARRIVSRSVCDNAKDESTILATLDQLD